MIKDILRDVNIVEEEERDYDERIESRKEKTHGGIVKQENLIIYGFVLNNSLTVDYVEFEIIKF